MRARNPTNQSGAAHKRKTRGMNSTEIIGLRTASVRRSIGWTQQDLAAAAGLTQATIANYEQGKRNRLATVEIIAAALGVPVATLLPSSPPPPVNGSVSFALCQQLIPLFERMTEDSRAELLRLARLLAA